MSCIYRWDWKPTVGIGRLFYVRFWLADYFFRVQRDRGTAFHSPSTFGVCEFIPCSTQNFRKVIGNGSTAVTWVGAILGCRGLVPG